MWISLADSIHKTFLIIVKIFDIKSSLPRTPTLPLQSLSSSIVNCYIFKFVFIHYSVHSRPCSLPVTVICIYLKRVLYIPLGLPVDTSQLRGIFRRRLYIRPSFCGHFICVWGLQSISCGLLHRPFCQFEFSK